MDNYQITQRKIFRQFFIYWVVFTPFCLSRFKSISILQSNSAIETIKMAFPCSEILYLCFKSLGLDITSMLLNPFKMAATYLFLWFLSIKEFYGRLIPRDTYTLNRKSLINSNRISFWIENLLELDSFDFYIEDIFTKLFNLLIGINPRSLPQEMN